MGKRIDGTKLPWKEYVRYDATSGRLWWIKSPVSSVSVGQECGTLTRSGYRRVYFRRLGFPAHRIIWFLQYGVIWDAERKRWKARIMVKGKNLNLGRHTSLEAAASAYDAAAKKYHGEFARLNFPEGK